MGLRRIPPEVFQALGELVLVTPADLERAWRLATSGEGYRTWHIPRGDGRTRRIDAPVRDLRAAQQQLLARALYRVPVSPVAHGFVPGRSIVTNARVHLPTAKAVLSLDLENAFPSTSADRVRRAVVWGLGWLVRSSYPRLVKESRADLFDVVTDLCCHNGRLPQGAPTSGAALNAACAGLDRRCTILVRENPDGLPELRYTRYADDLTFTSAAEISGTFRERVVRAVRAEGYRVNPRKVHHYASRDRDLVICGVRLHAGELTLPKEVIRRYRAMFYQALAYDPAAVPDEVRNHLHGAIGFLSMVCPTCPAALREPFQAVVARHGAWLRPARRSEPFARFLSYLPSDDPPAATT